MTIEPPSNQSGLFRWNYQNSWYEFVFLRLSLLHCRYRSEMLNHDVGSLSCTKCLLKHKKSPYEWWQWYKNPYLPLLAANSCFFPVTLMWQTNSPSFVTKGRIHSVNLGCSFHPAEWAETVIFFSFILKILIFIGSSRQRSMCYRIQRKDAVQYVDTAASPHPRRRPACHPPQDAAADPSPLLAYKRTLLTKRSTRQSRRVTLSKRHKSLGRDSLCASEFM